MLKRKAHDIITRAKVQLPRTSCPADKLLRQCNSDASIGVASIPRTLHKHLLIERWELETRLALARGLLDKSKRPLLVGFSRQRRSEQPYNTTYQSLEAIWKLHRRSHGYADQHVASQMHVGARSSQHSFSVNHHLNSVHDLLAGLPPRLDKNRRLRGRGPRVYRYTKRR